jgi:DNA-binding NarL/FixJ family response regulator
MRVLIVDDNEAVRRGIARLLAPEKDYEVCGEAEHGVGAIQKVRELQPDLVLLDMSMPGLSGLDTARLLRREWPEIKILILSQNDAAHLLPIALDAGADGFVDKSSIATDLLRMIKSVVDGSSK